MSNYYEQQFNIIYYNTLFIIEQTINTVINWVKSFYKTSPKYLEPHKDFENACINNDLKTMKEIYSLNESYILPDDLNKELVRAGGEGYSEIVEWLIEIGATEVDKGLEHSCKNNRYTTAEIFMKNGADVYVGLRNTKSNNINRMLLRYKQNIQGIR